MKSRTITLTNRAPVRIQEEDWPVIAKGSGFSGQIKCQANEEWFIRVRQHADGRTIVYAVMDRGEGGMPLSYHGKRGGEVLEGDGIPASIRRVGEEVGIPDDCINDCIADLPAEEL